MMRERWYRGGFEEIRHLGALGIREDYLRSSCPSLLATHGRLTSERERSAEDLATSYSVSENSSASATWHVGSQSGPFGCTVR